MIGEWSGKHDSAGSVERFHVCQVGRAINFSFGLPVGAIKTEDDEFHSRGLRRT